LSSELRILDDTPLRMVPRMILENLHSHLDPEARILLVPGVKGEL
jgi:hypothetical protein